MIDWDGKGSLSCMNWRKHWAATIAAVLLAATPARSVLLSVPAQTEGLAGESTNLFVYLRPEGATVATAHHDLSVAPPLAIRVKPDGTPDCEDRTHTFSGTFLFLPPGCAGESCAGVRALIDVGVPIGFGTAIYTCVVEVAADTPPGFYAATMSSAGSEDSEGNVLPTAAESGAISVPELPKVATLVVGSAEGAPGETVSFDVTVKTTVAAWVIGGLNFIDFDPMTPVLVDGSGAPACTANPSVGQPGSFSFSPAGCIEGVSCNALYADVGDTGDMRSFPSGEVMYSCQVAISPFASPGIYPLFCTGEYVVDYNSLIDSHCSSGEIHVLALHTPTTTPTATPQPSSLTPASTSTVRPTLTPQRSDSGSCAIVAPVTSGTWCLLWLPVAALLGSRLRGRAV
ncbi:MAG: hypothetical protein ACRERC_14795 [Candidatus Binatia bacterium]